MVSAAGQVEQPEDIPANTNETAVQLQSKTHAMPKIKLHTTHDG